MLGYVLATILYINSPDRSQLIQCALSMQLWKGKLNQILMNQLSRLGICRAYPATLRAVDKITSQFDMETNEPQDHTVQVRASCATKVNIGWGGGACRNGVD